MNYQEIVNELRVGTLKNTDLDTFWYTDRTFSHRYKHENGKIGDTFYDGNNGDKWKVLAANTKQERLMIENITQGGVMLVIWD